MTAESMTKAAAIRNISAILGGVLLVYALSFGPVYAFVSMKYRKVPETLTAVYRPLIKAPVIGPVFVRYFVICRKACRAIGVKTAPADSGR